MCDKLSEGTSLPRNHTFFYHDAVNLFFLFYVKKVSKGSKKEISSTACFYVCVLKGQNCQL